MIFKVEIFRNPNWDNEWSNVERTAVDRVTKFLLKNRRDSSLSITLLLVIDNFLLQRKK